MTSYLELLAAGFGLGLSVAAPLGPVSAAAIREGLERGIRAAFLVGLGAAAVDFIYLGLVYAGVAPLLLRVPGLVTGFYLLGAALLAWMAYGALRAALRNTPPATVDKAKGNRGFLYGVGITLLNPATVLSWLGLGGAFASAYLTGLSPSASIPVLLAVFLGSAAWFLLLALFTGAIRHLAMGGKGQGQGHPWVFRAVNGAAGLALGVFAITFVLKAL